MYYLFTKVFLYELNVFGELIPFFFLFLNSLYAEKVQRRQGVTIDDKVTSGFI